MLPSIAPAHINKGMNGIIPANPSEISNIFPRMLLFWTSPYIITLSTKHHQDQLLPNYILFSMNGCVLYFKEFDLNGYKALPDYSMSSNSLTIQGKIELDADEKKHSLQVQSPSNYSPHWFTCGMASFIQYHYPISTPLLIQLKRELFNLNTL